MHPTTPITHSIFAVAFLLLLSSCSSTSVFEKVVVQSEEGWHSDSILTFTFTVPEDGHYDLYYIVKNRTDYPFSNLYLKYDFRGETSQGAKGLQEIMLFHPVTGKPYGKGLGGIMEHKFYAFQHKELHQGEHQLLLQHYMRQQVLNGVLAIGIRLDQTSE